MNIETPDQKLVNIRYGDEMFQSYLDHIKNVPGDNCHLSLFVGLFEPDKKKALKKVRNYTGKPIEHINIEGLVSKIEKETFRNLDDLFNKYGETDSILYFEQGDKLCGAYTGFTHSKVKYATPQERYFLNKVQKFDGIIIIDISENDNADLTLRRAAHSIVLFPVPKSPFRKLIWSLKHYSLHGYDIRTKRPEEYAES